MRPVMPKTTSGSGVRGPTYFEPATALKEFFLTALEKRLLLFGCGVALRQRNSSNFLKEFLFARPAGLTGVFHPRNATE